MDVDGYGFAAAVTNSPDNAGTDVMCFVDQFVISKAKTDLERGF